MSLENVACCRDFRGVRAAFFGAGDITFFSVLLLVVYHNSGSSASVLHFVPENQVDPGGMTRDLSHSSLRVEFEHSWALKERTWTITCIASGMN